MDPSQQVHSTAEPSKWQPHPLPSGLRQWLSQAQTLTASSSAHSKLTHPEPKAELTGVGLSLLSESVMSGTRDHLVKCTDINARLQDHEASGKHDTTKGN